MLTFNAARRPLFLLLATYLLLTGYYSFSTPLFEAPDAYFHFAVTEYIARTGALPPKEDPLEHPWEQIVYHAPLYYVTSALLIAPVDTSDFLAAYPRNPHAQVGEPKATHNQTFVAHSGDPWHKTGLAARIIRFYSMGWGLVTLLGVFWLGRGLVPGRAGLAYLAVLVLILQPQFVYLNGMISNDGMVTALCSLSLALTVHIVRRGITQRRALMLAVLLACAALTKTNALAMYPAAVLGILWVVKRDGIAPKKTAGYLATIGLAWLLLAGWWYFDNLVRLGDPFAIQVHAEVFGTRPAFENLTGELRGMYYSYWGLFGWFNIIAPPWFYTLTLGLLAAALLGWVLGMGRARWRRDDAVIVMLLALTVLVMAASWWRFNRLVLAGQGRLFFPVAGIFACAIAGGLRNLPSRVIVAPLLGGMVLAELVFPPLLIRPALVPEDGIQIADFQPPVGAVRVAFREPWVEESCLNLWALPAQAIPGEDAVNVDLIWEARCSITGYWSVFAHLVDLSKVTCQPGDTGDILAQFDTMPDGGKLPFPAFEPGYAVRETIRLEIPADIDLSDDNIVIRIGLYDAAGTFIRMLVSEAPEALEGTGVTMHQCAPEAVNIKAF